MRVEFWSYVLPIACKTLDYFNDPVVLSFWFSRKMLDLVSLWNAPFWIYKCKRKDFCSLWSASWVFESHPSRECLYWNWTLTILFSQTMFRKRTHLSIENAIKFALIERQQKTSLQTRRFLHEPTLDQLKSFRRKSTTIFACGSLVTKFNSSNSSCKTKIVKLWNVEITVSTMWKFVWKFILIRSSCVLHRTPSIMEHGFLSSVDG